MTGGSRSYKDLFMISSKAAMKTSRDEEWLHAPSTIFKLAKILSVLASRPMLFKIQKKRRDKKTCQPLLSRGAGRSYEKLRPLPGPGMHTPDEERLWGR